MRRVHLQLAVVAFVVAWCVSGADGAMQPRTKSKVVTVTMDSTDVGKLQRAIGTDVSKLMTEGRVVDPAFTETIDTPMQSPAAVARAQHVHATSSTSRHRLTLRVQISVDEANAEKLDRFSKNLIAQFERVLLEDWTAARTRQVEARAELDQRAAALRQSLAEIEELQRQILKQSGRASLDRSALIAERNKLDEERRTLKVTQLAQEARIAALSENIRRIAQQAQEGVARSEVITQLETVVGVRERVVARARALEEKGMAGNNDVDEALEKLAMAKCDLARARADLVREAGGELLAKLQADLVSVSVESAETAVRLTHTEALIAEFDERALLNLALRYQADLETRRVAHSQQVSQLKNDQFMLENDEIGEQPPKLTVTYEE